MLAAMFVFGGLDAARHPESKIEPAKKMVDSLPVDADPKMMVRLNGIVQVGAGALLALGKVPRLSAAVLAGSLVPTTLAGHRFWEKDGPDRAAQQVHFLKNVAMFGGLILAMGDTDGRPSTGWKVRRTAGRTVDRAHSLVPHLG